jgi:Ca2+-binding EF-hand superfamily protein
LNSLYPHQEKDISIDRGINYLEFVALVSNVLNYQAGCGEIQPNSLQKIFCETVLSNGSTMRESFKRLDVDGSGYLDKNEIIRVLNAHKIQYSAAELNALLQQFDTNKDGLICYSEFVKMLQGTSAIV